MTENTIRTTGAALDYLKRLTQGDPWAPEALQALTDAVAARSALLAFAVLVRDFFDTDSAGHAVYLKEQANNAIEEATQ